MLLELSIRNLAVIESVRISFKQGFHVLTGETGAGKSIIIDALGLIAGGRASSEWVRYGEDKAEIEACFEMDKQHPVWETLHKLGIESEDDTIVIRREITAQGKSVSRINGQIVNQSMLKEAGEWLINIHGQHEHQSLLKTDRHIDWLDMYAGEPMEEAGEAYRECYRQYVRLRKEISELEERSKNDLHMLDLYRFQIEEITAAALKPGEDEWLAEEKRKLANAEKLYQNVTDAYETLYASQQGLEAVSKAAKRVEEVADVDRSALQPILEQLQSAYYQLEDAAYQLRDYKDAIEFNPGRLDEIEQRLDMIAALRRKYGQSVEHILDYLEQIQTKVDQIENKDERLQQLQQALTQQEKQLAQLAARLSDYRSAAARQLSSAIMNELKDLQMERTRMEVQISRTEDNPEGLLLDGKRVKFGPTGVDQVEFLISPNPGEPLRSLHKIASGGELSRIMLAMKSIFARMDRIPVLVFDEVDTGVSGRAAQAIAEKLSALSRACQVFSITHLPQVACMADGHYEISKEVQGERTYTRVRDLTLPERTEELARMLGGVEITETTLNHAGEMLKMANEKKRKQQAG